LEQYEKKYRAALAEAVRAVNPNWTYGDSFDASILDSVTRESVESQLTVSGNTLVRKGIDYSI
jgi:NADPH-dependent 7-cyano-7-deazaguanine reductase QueF-like protein